jgi:hypothetical protein
MGHLALFGTANVSYLIQLSIPNPEAGGVATNSRQALPPALRKDSKGCGISDEDSWDNFVRALQRNVHVCPAGRLPLV